MTDSPNVYRWREKLREKEKNAKMTKDIRVEMFWSKGQPIARIIVELPMEPIDSSLSKTEGYRKISDEIVRLLVEYDEKRREHKEEDVPVNLSGAAEEAFQYRGVKL